MGERRACGEYFLPGANAGEREEFRSAAPAGRARRQSAGAWRFHAAAILGSRILARRSTGVTKLPTGGDPAHRAQRAGKVADDALMMLLTLAQTDHLSS